MRNKNYRRKVSGSIPNEVTGVFNLPNPSSRTMALESTQPLTEMSTRNLRKCGSLDVSQPYGLPRLVLTLTNYFNDAVFAAEIKLRNISQ
jgi:hypothetical protein